jgi:hypothetical protein
VIRNACILKISYGSVMHMGPVSQCSTIETVIIKLKCFACTNFFNLHFESGFS